MPYTSLKSIIAFVIFNNIPSTNAFTISLAPLLTRLAPWGNNYVNQFSQTAPSLHISTSDSRVQNQNPVTIIATPRTKPFALNNLHFEQVDMLSDYKIELLEYVYSKNMDRGFV